MGNCCRPASSSSLEWGGEDRDSLKSENNNTNRKRSSRKVFDEGHGLSLGKVKRENLSGVVLRASYDANGTVKIMISKKELTELLVVIMKQNHMKKKQVVGINNCCAEQVLFRLIKTREHANSTMHDSHHDRPWRPVPQSIPEVMKGVVQYRD